MAVIVRHACLRNEYVRKSTYEQMCYGRCLLGSCCPPLRSVMADPVARSVGAVEVLADRSGVRSRSAESPSQMPRTARRLVPIQSATCVREVETGYQAHPLRTKWMIQKSCKRLPSRES